ncbi:hypothetical protein [Pedobacter sp. MC2016-24]|uniref:hypothetical protein n=1 Tax=Pedobacter sp. MC2016-24 TaxID=2780090 RepID=UPI00187F22BD|nr:hypothetical protein [Pedobacter sp. MC2016-24]MBE9601896.1 hypothetical protein [Pedobacter sp. MC2016-24]
MTNRRQFLRKSALLGAASLTADYLLANDKVAEHHGPKPGSECIYDGKIYQNIKFQTFNSSNDILNNAIRIFNRELHTRTGLDFSTGKGNPLTIELRAVPQSMPLEAFRIEHLEADRISIKASDDKGLLFGLGKLLHTSLLTTAGFTPGTWQGLSVPEKPFRMIYFATHFYNFYHEAPIDQVIKYIEDLAFWGYNGIAVWFDMHHYNGIRDAEAQLMIDRLALLLQAGKSVGMKTMLTMLANEGYASSPLNLRAKAPKQVNLRGKYGVEICPSQPGGAELILKQVDQELDEFIKRGVAVDYLSLWPYDQGGCGCDQCTPWGSNGFLKMTNRITKQAQKKIPGLKTIQSTWLFDIAVDEGEWAGLAKAYNREKPVVSYIMADSHETFPKYLMNNPVPGNLPLLNFPEISMWNSWPWGGFGANPLPQRFQDLWSPIKDQVAGGYLYSEGLFEDLNKVLYSRFYWDSQEPVGVALREYVAFNFSIDHADRIIEAIHIMEKNHGLNMVNNELVKNAPTRFTVPENDFGAKRAYQLLSDIDLDLPRNVKTSWRWRILMLRAMFDVEFRLSKGVENPKIIAGFKELGQIYSSKKANIHVRPPLI